MKWFLTAFLCLALWPACSKTDPLYCDEQTTCMAGLPACDVEGICPESEHIANTCITVPCWDAGVEPDGSQVPPIDGSTLADGTVDYDAAPTLGAWGTPVKVTGGVSSDYGDRSPSISASGLELYFDRIGQINGGAIMRATRPYIGGFWTLTGGVRTGHSAPDIAPNGLELYTVSANRIFRSVRGSTDSTDWGGASELFPGFHPSLAKGGLALYYVEDGELMRRERTNLSTSWQAPTAVALPPADDYADLAVSDDELFAIATALDGGEIVLYELNRSSQADSWGDPVVIHAFDGVGTPLLCDLLSKSEMFCQVNDVNGSGDIYYVEREQP